MSYTVDPDNNLKTGVLSAIQINDDGTYQVAAKSAGTVDYIKGEIILNTINIISTENDSAANLYLSRNLVAPIVNALLVSVSSLNPCELIFNTFLPTPILVKESLFITTLPLR